MACRTVVLAVGSDCATGKMSAMLEIERVANQGRLRAQFVAAGQTGILIAGKGIAVDRVISDFVAGAAERPAVTICRQCPCPSDVRAYAPMQKHTWKR